ncbi:MAG TPA: orotate phosphoribosyltransferase [Acidimicrobiia bacterium]|nr:orotate phosphoribosyltransferase [Acidimicrobiia bacterium]
MTTSAREQLVEALRTYAIREGEFTLASGRTSSWYLDGRQVTFRGDLQPVIGRAVVDTLDAAGVGDFDAVGGLTLGADPVAVAVATAKGIRAFSVRKEPKGHGAGGRMAGPVEPGDRVLVVDDTITTGGSLIQAVEAIRDFGCEIVAATCLLDRGGVVGSRLETMGVPFHPVLGAPDVGQSYDG